MQLRIGGNRSVFFITCIAPRSEKHSSSSMNNVLLSISRASHASGRSAAHCFFFSFLFCFFCSAGFIAKSETPRPLRMSYRAAIPGMICSLFAFFCFYDK
ncbi:hypothetical protein GGI42DRAFT_334619 [Trichoderma sp. SZMC 28013]